MAKEVKIPQISEGVDTATVAEVLVSEGDEVKKEDSLIVVESDKASVEVPSPFGGTVKEIKVKEGDEVNVGDVIVLLEGEDEEEEEEGDKDEGTKEEKSEKEDEKKEKKTKKEDSEKEEKSEEKLEEEKDSEEEAAGEEEKEVKTAKESKDKTSEDMPAPASPGVRRLARELGIDINSVKGTGEAGRITEEDVKQHAKKISGGTPEGTLSLPDFSKWGEIERKPLSGIRQATAKHTAASWKNIPHVFQFDEADISGIEGYLEKHTKKAEKKGVKITITTILLKIVATALRQFPKFNASIDLENKEMILKKYLNIGIAVATEKGLLMPVIRDVDKKGILELATELSELAEKARAGKLEAGEMEGGNFSISNLGGIGGTNFTPIIYHPQVAILGVSRAKTQPVLVDGKFEAREVLPLSLSYDHRLIDGAEGAEFLSWIVSALEDPYKALLGA